MYTFVAILSVLISICNGLSGQVTLSNINKQTLEVDIDTTAMKTTIILSGRSEGWIGVGFNGSDMNNTYAIVADYNSDKIYELDLGSGHCSPGCDKQLTQSFTVNSNKVSDGVRTINIVRPVTGNGPDYYSFPTTASKVPLIWAFGIPGQTFLNATDMADASNKDVLDLS